MIRMNSFGGGLKPELQLDKEIVFLKGLNERERISAPGSMVRGELKINTRGKSYDVDKITIKFLGRSLETVYTKSSTARYLRNQEARKIVEEVYQYSFAPEETLEGSYSFPFLFVLDPDLPESIRTCLGSRTYSIEASMDYGEETKELTTKSIALVRGPLEGSVLLSECIQALGSWREYMQYDLSISSKHLVLGDNFTFNFNLEPLFEDRSCVIEEIKVHFIQKLQCEKRSEFFGDTDTFDICDRYLIKHIIPSEVLEGSEIYRHTSIVKIPKSMPFSIHPHISNKHLPEYINTKGLRVSHCIQLALKVKSIVKSSMVCKDGSMVVSSEIGENLTTPLSDQPPSSHSSQSSHSTSSLPSDKMDKTEPILQSTIFMRIPIYLLASSAVNQPSPPTYEEAIQSQEHEPKRNKAPVIFNPLRLARFGLSKDTHYPPEYVQDC